MRTRTRDFPGADPETNHRLTEDVERDEATIINGLIEIRRENQISFEVIGFLLGSDASLISRNLRGNGVTLTNFLRIARALGYRCRVSFEKADETELDAVAISNLQITSHKVRNPRQASRS